MLHSYRIFVSVCFTFRFHINKYDAVLACVEKFHSKKKTNQFLVNLTSYLVDKGIMNGSKQIPRVFNKARSPRQRTVVGA